MMVWLGRFGLFWFFCFSSFICGACCCQMQQPVGYALKIQLQWLILLLLIFPALPRILRLLLLVVLLPFSTTSALVFVLSVVERLLSCLVFLLHNSMHNAPQTLTPNRPPLHMAMALCFVHCLLNWPMPPTVAFRFAIVGCHGELLILGSLFDLSGSLPNSTA